MDSSLGEMKASMCSTSFHHRPGRAADFSCSSSASSSSCMPELVCSITLRELSGGMQPMLAMTAKPSNQAMQQTASKPATHAQCVCHLRVGCVAHFTGLAVADLVSR